MNCPYINFVRIKILGQPRHYGNIISTFMAFTLSVNSVRKSVINAPRLSFRSGPEYTFHPDCLTALIAQKTTRHLRNKSLTIFLFFSSKVWASPFPSRLTVTIGRIEFVVLRTSFSPPVAPHHTSQCRSYVRLQVWKAFYLKGIFTPLALRTFRRTRAGIARRNKFHDSQISIANRHRINRFNGRRCLPYLAVYSHKATKAQKFMVYPHSLFFAASCLCAIPSPHFHEDKSYLLKNITASVVG